jgi:hypothetical protein
MKTRIGDRFKYTAMGGQYWFEVIDREDEEFILIKIIKTENRNFPIDEIIDGYPDPMENGHIVEYLGNFSKSNKFKTIYEILNSSNDADSGI